MFKFNNNHIFTGYLKQLLSNFNLPNCRIYTKDFADYFNQHGKEDPRVIESISTLGPGCLATQVNYIKDREIQHLSWNLSSGDKKNCYWNKSSEVIFDPEVPILGLTRTLKSAGTEYDQATHEYLGDYLRFLRDYYDVNLMSLYNCFNNKIYSNIFYKASDKNIKFDSYDSDYIIYAFPVKLFNEYTIAIDSHAGIELFCGFYGTYLDTSDKSETLILKTYEKLNTCSFKNPYLFKKLTEENWNFDSDISVGLSGLAEKNRKHITRWDIASREKDLKLFIKVPASCRSSITVLEGDYRFYNDAKYDFEASSVNPQNGVWKYKANHTVLNLNKHLNQTDYKFKPISKLQLLELNTGESYPFATRLVEYLSGNTITPLDIIPDNVKRVQKIASSNQHYSRIEGLWEDKLQKLIYDQLINGGPYEAVSVDKMSQVQLTDGTKANVKKLVDRVLVDPEDSAKILSFNKTNLVLKQKPNQKAADMVLIDHRRGLQPRNGHKSKSTLYDILGYVDKDAEKWFSSWELNKDNSKATIKDTLQNVDIYNGLYDIE